MIRRLPPPNFPPFSIPGNPGVIKTKADFFDSIGQKRQFGRASAMSGLALTADTETNALGWSLRGARQAALSLVTIHVIQHTAAVPSVTSTRTEGEAGALLQTLAQRRTHQRARRPGAALALHVAHEAESALGDHLAGPAVARIALARNYRLDPSAIRQLAQEEDVVEALLR